MSRKGIPTSHPLIRLILIPPISLPPTDVPTQPLGLYLALLQPTVAPHGQRWLNQGTLDVLVVLFGTRTCTLGVRVILFGFIGQHYQSIN